MQEAERGGGSIGLGQEAARRLQQLEGSGDVGDEERAGPVDRAVDVRLGREVDDPSWSMLAEQRLHGIAVGDVGLDEHEARVAGHGGQANQVSRVRQLVGDDDAGAGALESQVDEVRTDESGPARHEHRVQYVHPVAPPPAGQGRCSRICQSPYPTS